MIELENLRAEVEFKRIESNLQINRDAEFYYSYDIDTGLIISEVFLSYQESVSSTDYKYSVAKFTVNELNRQVDSDIGLVKRAVNLCSLLSKRLSEESSDSTVVEIRKRVFA